MPTAVLEAEHLERLIEQHETQVAALEAEREARETREASAAAEAQWRATPHRERQPLLRAARALARAVSRSGRPAAARVDRRTTSRPRERRARTARRSSVAAGASDDGPAPPLAEHRAPVGAGLGARGHLV